MVHQVVIQRVLTSNENTDTAAARVARASNLLHKRGAGSGPFAGDGGVEAGNVDTELQGIGGDNGLQDAHTQLLFQFAPLLGQIPATVRTDPVSP